MRPADPPASTITVGGLPGTGTSTLCRLLERELGLPYHYAGALFRAEAERRGMTLAEFGALSQRDPSIDEALDDRQIGLLRKGGIILEGRLSGWLAARHRLPAFKVWVTCEDRERVRRIVQRDGGDEAAQRAATEGREASEADRYRRYYGADLNDLSRYDLVLDSTHAAPEELAAQVRQALARQVAKP
ncbi:MAG TPA: cytidylate kinase family protein [Candidatus Thermoplasmatota archaeon]|nr:cytidylate kinase family protein [Candidatus Thermoplasmatota archaeon]